ncbi:MAG: hypothetical protein RIC06_13910 [Cyclobacteriaceae bacterium]
MKLKMYILLCLGLSIYLASGQKKSEVPSCFLFEEFVEGTMLMKDGQSKKMFVNYNKSTEALLVASGPIIMGINDTENELLDTAYINDRKFIRLDNKFLELCYHSKNTTLLVQYKCNITYSTSVSYLPIGFRRDSHQITSFSTRVSDRFIVDEYKIYWIKKDGILHEVTSQYDFKRIFTDQKKQLRKYIVKHDVDFNDTKEVKALVRFLDEESSYN